MSRRRISRARLAALRKGRRETLYRMLKRRHYGVVPCYCCGEHVEPADATLEHILPRSRGGTDHMSNLSISHAACNHARGAA